MDKRIEFVPSSSSNLFLLTFFSFFLCTGSFLNSAEFIFSGGYKSYNVLFVLVIKCLSKSNLSLSPVVSPLSNKSLWLLSNSSIILLFLSFSNFSHFNLSIPFTFSILQETISLFCLIKLQSFETHIAVRILSPVAIIILKSALSYFSKDSFVFSFNLFWTMRNPKNNIFFSTASLVIVWLCWKFIVKLLAAIPKTLYPLVV